MIKSQIEMVEWECILKCNMKCKYCTNGRNDCLSNPIKEITDLDILKKFLQGIHQKYSNIELFIFGGEPTLHPKINEIINILNNIKHPFCIQTNGSFLDKIKEPAVFQISVHRTQIKNIKKYLENIKLHLKNIRTIDVMFTDKDDIFLAKEIQIFFKNVKVAPVADFGLDNRTDFLPALEKFNRFKKIFPDLFEEGQRSYIWEKNEKGLISSKGNPCMYKDKYVLFAPDLQQYNCSHRLRTSICPFDRCFRM